MPTSMLDVRQRDALQSECNFVMASLSFWSLYSFKVTKNNPFRFGIQNYSK